MGNQDSRQFQKNKYETNDILIQTNQYSQNGNQNNFQENSGYYRDMTSNTNRYNNSNPIQRVPSSYQVENIQSQNLKMTKKNKDSNNNTFSNTKFIQNQFNNDSHQNGNQWISHDNNSNIYFKNQSQYYNKNGNQNQSFNNVGNYMIDHDDINQQQDNQVFNHSFGYNNNFNQYIQNQGNLQKITNKNHKIEYNDRIKLKKEYLEYKEEDEEDIEDDDEEEGKNDSLSLQQIDEQIQNEIKTNRNSVKSNQLSHKSDRTQNYQTDEDELEISIFINQNTSRGKATARTGRTNSSRFDLFSGKYKEIFIYHNYYITFGRKKGLAEFEQSQDGFINLTHNSISMDGHTKVTLNPKLNRIFEIKGQKAELNFATIDFYNLGKSLEQSNLINLEKDEFLSNVHCKIYFKRKSKKFYIRDHSEHGGIWIRLTEPRDEFTNSAVVPDNSCFMLANAYKISLNWKQEMV
ncbi:SMAD/FHA domain [Pseudocohnilembus persalinus]|uniref:SMAD/FHA domain n=1 Tax=Pseudocohnilembus persalinus TaxID=266149 RepID=A0A0V0Q8T3_PSEPJ|nr:SMAD/FHA domain [Pseudocohnilembus persalinus]|eukprot:KRW98658.1 SMAD/FHA domain [Pseudocohnilembus persalinus]